jgi:hypothetical protein
VAPLFVNIIFLFLSLFPFLLLRPNNDSMLATIVVSGNKGTQVCRIAR